MNRFSAMAVLVAGTLPLTVGCATKNYVRNQTTPIINNVNELDDETARNTRDIKDVDTRAQQGIAQVNDKAAAADQKALAAGQSADQANQTATGLALTIFGRGFSALVGAGYVGIPAPTLPKLHIPVLSDIPLLRPEKTDF